MKNLFNFESRITFCGFEAKIVNHLSDRVKPEYSRRYFPEKETFDNHEEMIYLHCYTESIELARSILDKVIGNKTFEIFSSYDVFLNCNGFIVTYPVHEFIDEVICNQKYNFITFEYYCEFLETRLSGLKKNYNENNDMHDHLGYINLDKPEYLDYPDNINNYINSDGYFIFEYNGFKLFITDKFISLSILDIINSLD